MAYINKERSNKITIIDPNRKLRQKIYGNPKWRKLRDTQLMAHPLCELCEKQGIIKVGIDVHHIKSFMTGTTLFEQQLLAYNPDNLQTLCKECHQLIHNQYDN